MDDTSKQEVRSGPAFTPDSSDAAERRSRGRTRYGACRLRALENRDFHPARHDRYRAFSAASRPRRSSKPVSPGPLPADQHLLAQ